MSRYILLILVLVFFSCSKDTYTNKKEKKVQAKKKFNELTAEEKYILLEKGTERPFSGKYVNFKGKGIYVCKQCDTPLFDSDDKFDSKTGWSSFDEDISDNVKRVPDADGRRTEIVCSTCGGHLGHVFLGERFTHKDTRHCVNSLALKFVPDGKLKKAIFASGCFWGTEYFLQKVDGVIETTVGYIGGKEENPTYRQVSSKQTGHAEAVEVLYDPTKVSYEELAKLFFETHDPTQLNRQGPDIGAQYRSEVFVFDDEQRKIIEKLIAKLRKKGYDVVTEVTDATIFWTGENYHQDYYKRKGTLPYCHIYKKKFD